jgi:DNA repair exonuclease SbcCD ATPase subunit
MTVAAKHRHDPVQTQTDIAVLQVHVETIQHSITDLKADIKEIHTGMEKNMQEMKQSLLAIQSSAVDEHRKLSEKISSLEKWRYMIMGAGIVLGAVGFNTFSSVIQQMFQ